MKSGRFRLIALAIMYAVWASAGQARQAAPQAVSGMAVSKMPAAAAQAEKKSMAGESAAQALIDMERQWAEVCVTHDTSVLQEVLADDFLGTNTDGKLYAKAEDIQKVARSHNKYLSGRVDNVKVRFFGENVAVLYGVETCIKSVDGDKQEPEINIWTDTWLKRDGRWQIVAAQDMRQTSAQSQSAALAEQEKRATSPPANMTHPQSSEAQAPAVETTEPNPEMRSLMNALAGRWSIREKYEPDEWTPNGGVGEGEEVWRSGPGGFTFMEEVHDQTPAGESFGLALTWWDKTKGFQGMWCINSNPKGCEISPGPGPKWDGKQPVLDAEFERSREKFAWHEVYSDITPTSFTQTADIGELGAPLKRWLTIRGTRVAEASMKPEESSSAEAELRADTTELTRLAREAGHAYARRDLPALERLTADDYIQTDVRGGVLNRSQWLEFVKNRKTELTVESNDVQVSFYGSAAVVRGHWTYTSKRDGKDGTSYSQWTSVWTRYPDGWKRHVFQNTYVNANADGCATEVRH